MSKRWNIEHAGSPAQDPGNRKWSDYALWIAGIAIVSAAIYFAW